MAQRFANATLEEAQRELQSWLDWAEKLGPALLDPGKPIGNAVNVNSGGINPSDSDVIGMSILKCSTRDKASPFTQALLQSRAHEQNPVRCRERTAFSIAT